MLITIVSIRPPACRSTSALSESARNSVRSLVQTFLVEDIEQCLHGLDEFSWESVVQPGKVELTTDAVPVGCRGRSDGSRRVEMSLRGDLGPQGRSRDSEVGQGHWGPGAPSGPAHLSAHLCTQLHRSLENGRCIGDRLGTSHN